MGDILHGQAKADAVQALAQRNGFALDRCAAYSDSINDLPLLELVGEPHAVNPDHQLRHLANERDWAVHDFRTARHALRIATPVAGAAVGSAIAWKYAAQRIKTGSGSRPAPDRLRSQRDR